MPNNRPILSATIRRAPPTARKSRRKCRVERPAINPRLTTRHNFGECHFNSIFTLHPYHSLYST
jgi:hypothetical protein